MKTNILVHSLRIFTLMLLISHPRESVAQSSSLCEPVGGEYYPEYTSFGPPYQTPVVGEYCPPTYGFDSRNCHLKEAPDGTTPFIYAENFYYTPLPGPSCEPPDYYDGANCYVDTVPSGYKAFLYSRAFYTQTNPHFVYKRDLTACPPGLSYDGANCFFRTTPHGMAVTYKSRFPYPYGFWFAFTKHIWESCSDLYPGSIPVSRFHCGMRKIPCGFTPFTYHNGWYVKPKGSNSGAFQVKKYISDASAKSRPACTSNPTPKIWQLHWSDEFNDVPDNTQCYTTNEHLQCIYKTYATYRTCIDAPTVWDAASRLGWSPQEHETFDGVVNLNKCVWHVHDGFNSWDYEEKMSRFRTDNIKIEDGLLKMYTASHPPPNSGRYNCGRDYNNGQFDTTTAKCPYSGATLTSPSLLPWTKDNSWNNPDPEKRYTGMRIAAGRIEFRANINMIGHGAFPALWMFVDQKWNSAQGNGELDALEFVADFQGRADQITGQNATYGMAWQTAHNWGMPDQGYPHTSEVVGIPITIGEWHTYAIEFDDTEIRFFIDDCMRNRLVEGQQIQLDDGSWRVFHVPGEQDFNILIGNPASSASFLPAWYKAYSGIREDPLRDDFVPTELLVDYVRYYHEQ